MLLSPTNPPGIELYSFVNVFFSWFWLKNMLIHHVSPLNKEVLLIFCKLKWIQLNRSPGFLNFQLTKTLTWLCRWLAQMLSKRQSQTTVLLRTPIIQMIFFNQGKLNNILLWIVVESFVLGIEHFSQLTRSTIVSFFLNLKQLGKFIFYSFSYTRALKNQQDCTSQFVN